MTLTSKGCYNQGIMSPTITLDRQALAEFCRRNHIRKLSVFGSAVRADFRPDSDMDLLAEFEPGRTPGLAFYSLGDDLTVLFGRRVDLNTLESLSPYFRDRVLAELEVLYDATRP